MHSSLPWIAKDYAVFSGDDCVATCNISPDNSDANDAATDADNAALIAQAANSHAAMVQALGNALSWYRAYAGPLSLVGPGSMPTWVTDAEHALAKAR
jgi:hypothetical protein